MSVNKALILGHIGSDIELKETSSGSMVCNFRVATTEKYKTKAGEQKEQTEWHNIVAWQALAESTTKYCKKGSQVYIEGKIQTKEWTDKHLVKRFTTEINAKVIQFLSPKSTSKTIEPDGNMMDGNYNISTKPTFTTSDIPF